MVHLEEVQIAPRPIERFIPLLGEEVVRDALALAAETARRMAGRSWWNVNSTARGGGVAEMLQSLLAYARGAGIDARWLVITGSPPFYRITKRLHHAIHGMPGDGSPLGEAEHAVYEEVLAANAAELLATVRPRDIVLLHDPQTAGLAPHLIRHGAEVVWRCHIGADTPNHETELAWAFLRPYLESVPATIFSRRAYIPAWCDPDRRFVVAPSIDAFSPKNQDLDDAAVRAILVHTGLIAGPSGPGQPLFHHDESTPGRVDRQADVIQLGPSLSWEAPLVVQVSRWDPLKDPIGVMHGFVRLLERDLLSGAELLLAGPNVSAVTDDPDGAATFDATFAAWRALPHAFRGRVRLASLPMADVAENGAIVNALQRHATVLVQKSLREGFGLTVTEAMWKARPIVASKVGGIQDQIVDGEHGLLLDDPTDLAAFAALLRRLLTDPSLALRLGTNAKERARERYLGVRHLEHYARILAHLEEPATHPYAHP